MENVDFVNVNIAVQGPDNTAVLSGQSGRFTVRAWGQGHEYTPDGPASFQGTITPFERPKSLLEGSKYYERSKPDYRHTPKSQFSSVRDAGAKGDGKTDETIALQATLDDAEANNRIVFFDYGVYRVTKTINIPKCARIVGESYPIILSSGRFFTEDKNPKPVVRVGQPGEIGTVEWSDMVVGTQGAQAGAILIEWNVASAEEPSGMWDVHTRIGGFAGSDLQLADCPSFPTNSNNESSTASNYTSRLSSKTNGTAHNTSTITATIAASATSSSSVNKQCIGAFMSMHITKSASNIYMENVWLWTADHDLEIVLTNITVYAGRGLYVESHRGDIWL